MYQQSVDIWVSGKKYLIWFYRNWAMNYYPLLIKQKERLKWSLATSE
jgi:hypothetical protein